MKVLIFDSGPLINLSMNGFLGILEKLKKQDMHFLITEEVRKEIYETPLKIRQYELGALKINELIAKGVIEMPDAVNVDEKELTRASQALTDKSNHLFKTEGSWIKEVSEAEMSCIQLATQLKKKNIDVMVAIDERTARMLIEKPENLSQLMSQHLHKSVIQIGSLPEIQGIPCIRSSEILFVAHKKGLLGISDKKALEAVLYASKFKGSSISWDEIDVLKKL